MKQKSKIIDKIRKCLKLGKDGGATEHEAAAAMRQAQKLMQEHQISELDILAAEASEQRSKASARERPAQWECNLAAHCARVFACKTLFDVGWKNTDWVFTGTGPNPEIAKFSFDVLLRQCKAARKVYANTALKRCKPATRIKRADVYCIAWVHEAVGKLATLTRTEQQEKAIAAYYESKAIKTQKLKANDRNQGKKLNGADIMAGLSAGSNAQLHNGMGAAASAKALADDRKAE